MKSISKSIANMLNASMKVTYPFDDVASISKNDKNTDYDYYSDISINLFSKYKDKMLKLWGATNTPPTPQSYSEEIMVNIIKNPGFIHKISHDFDGKILFRLDNEFIEQSIKNLLISEGNYDQGLKNINYKSEIGVLYPFGEIIQKIHLNQFRGINISESLARIYEYLGYKTLRFSCLQNSMHFHGIVLTYLLEKRFDDNLDLEQKPVKFENLLKFLVEKGVKGEKDVVVLGGKAIEDIGNDEKKMKLFDKLNNLALEDMMRNYNLFLDNKQNLTIIDSFNLNRKMTGFIKELKEKGKVLYSEEDGYYIKLKKEKIIKLMDSQNLLTKQGVFLGFLEEISSLHFVDKVSFSTDLQDGIFYEYIQEGYGVLYNERRMPIKIDFYGHNSIFLEKNPNEKKLTVFLSNFLEEIIDLGIKKSMELSPTFPSNLTIENRKNMQKLLLGWLRFLDHKHRKEDSYILDMKESLNFIFSHEMVNIRAYLTDKLKDFKQTDEHVDSFKVDTIEQRILSVKLLEFIEVLEKVLQEKNMTVLVEYLELLCKMVTHYEKNNNNLLLTKATLIIISKCFYVLGVI